MKIELKYTFMDGIFPVLNCRLRWITFQFCEKNKPNYIELLLQNKPNTHTIQCKKFW